MEVQDKVFKQLELIKKEYGLEIIEAFIKQSKQVNKKRRGRPLSGIMTAAEVYFKLFGLDFENEDTYINFSKATIVISITEAKEIVSTKKSTQPKTVDNQVTAFNKYAKNMNYEDFCEEFNSYAQTQRYYDEIPNDLVGIQEFILFYAVERKEYDNISNICIKGDNRYSGLEIRIAIALILKYKYDKFKNAHNVPKKTENIPYNMPQQYYASPQQ